MTKTTWRKNFLKEQKLPIKIFFKNITGRKPAGEPLGLTDDHRLSGAAGVKERLLCNSFLRNFGRMLSSQGSDLEELPPLEKSGEKA